LKNVLPAEPRALGADRRTDAQEDARSARRAGRFVGVELEIQNAQRDARLQIEHHCVAHAEAQIAEEIARHLTAGARRRLATNPPRRAEKKKKRQTHFEKLAQVFARNRRPVRFFMQAKRSIHVDK
jgi:hypothetical protein